MRTPSLPVDRTYSIAGITHTYGSDFGSSDWQTLSGPATARLTPERVSRERTALSRLRFSMPDPREPDEPIEHRYIPTAGKREVIDAICPSAPRDSEAGRSVFASKNIDHGPGI
jgi:hypothetical protein